MASFQIRALTDDDREWVAHLLEEQWGGVRIVTRGRVHQADALPGFVALQEDERVGLIAYHVEADACEVVVLESLVEGIGIGTALLEAVKDVALAAGCRRLWLITTNDNVHALRFYQKRGLVLVAVHRNALEASRKLKPGIPLTGMHGIPLRDEIELEMLL